MDGPQVAEQSPQRLSLGEKLGADIARGKEGRLHTGERISKFFSSMKQKLYGGVDLAFAVPSIAGTLGGETGSFAQEKAEQVKNSVVEAGTRAWENTLDAKDRMVERVQDAGDRVRERIKSVGDAARRKTGELSKKAAVWGLANVVVPIENSAQAICQIPAELQQWRADSAASRAEDLNARAELERIKGEARVAALKARMEKAQREAEARVSNMSAMQEGARTKAEELRNRAAEKRGRVRGFFGRAGALVSAMRTT